jgi:1,4-alpha-glucan branching enzyme
MIKREILKKDNQVKVTFIQPINGSQERIFVVGDFNKWQPKVNPLVKRSNGTASASVTLPLGQRVYFRYVTEQNHWFNDEAADAYEHGEHGTENCVLIL